MNTNDPFTSEEVAGTPVKEELNVCTSCEG